MYFLYAALTCPQQPLPMMEETGVTALVLPRSLNCSYALISLDLVARE